MLFGTKLAGPSCCTWRHIVLYYETQPIIIGVPRRSVLRAGPPRPVPQLRNPFQVRFVTQWMKPHNGTS